MTTVGLAMYGIRRRAPWQMNNKKRALLLLTGTALVLVWGALNTSAELSTRFMSLLEIVIGAIFGVTATQITKG